MNKEKLSKKNKIKLYPFNGRSPYLIDKFYIIGYNYLTLHKLLIINNLKINEEESRESKELGRFIIDEEPYILNEISSDCSKEGLPNETILKMIFPKKVIFYYFSEECNNSNSRINTNNVNNFCKVEFKKDIIRIRSNKIIFSSNPQSGNNSKKSINGFAYTFYKRFKEKKKKNKREYNFFIPYTFCIISEFPFFNNFYKLCKCIKNLYSQNSLYMPIEFLISNIVSLTPSPINSDVKLVLKSLNEQKNHFGNYKKALSNTIPNFKTDDDLKNIKEITSIKQSGFVLLENNDNYYKNNDIRKTTFMMKRTMPLFNKQEKEKGKEKEKEKKEDELLFKALSGYPLIQYNLAKVLFNSMNPEKVICIFLYTFLEKDVIFFSKNIEHLTLTINAYLNLNFPLNDEKYYFIGTAISFEDFSYGESEFGLKNYTSIIGINEPFRPDYRNKNLKIKDHLVVDLDKGDIFFGNDENDSTVNENNKKILRLIKKICEERDDSIKDRRLLHRSVKKLNIRLKKIYESRNDANIHNQDKFLDYNEPNEAMSNDDNNKHNINIYENNREIQEAFYQFVHTVCLYFYESFTIKQQSEEKKQSNNNTKDELMNVIYNKNYEKDENKMVEEEIIFLKELSDTMKFQSFVYGFLQSYNPIDLFKIPLTFTEEFLSIISHKNEAFNNKSYKINYFDLIDSLYNIYKKTEKTLNFDVIIFNYFKLNKNKFDREIYDQSRTKYFNNNNNLIKFVNKMNNNNRILLYQTYELDDNLLLKYIHLNQNMNEKELNSSIYGTFFVKENKLDVIDVSEIESRIEQYCINERLLTTSDICCTNLLLLFVISLKFFKSSKEILDCQTFLCYLFQEFTIFRKYYSILLNMIYKLFDNKNNINAALCYYPCINSIRNKRLVPNEELLNIINELNQSDIPNLSNPEEEEKEKDINDESMKDKIENIDKLSDYLYVYKNFTPHRFVKEEEILREINMINAPEELEVILRTGETITPKIRFNFSIENDDKYECYFSSQKCILDKLIKEYKAYNEHLDVNKIGINVMLEASLNVFIFIRNNDKFIGKDDIFDTLKSIIKICVNRLYALKSIKEKKND